DGIRDFHVTGVQTCALPISGGQHQPPHSQTAAGKLFPELAGATAPRRESAGGRHPGGLHPRRQHAQGGRAGTSLGHDGHQQERGLRVCAELDEMVQEFRNRPLTGRYPYLWLDAKYIKVREGGRVLSMALVVAVGVKETGEREVLGFDVGLSEDGPFWTEFLRSLVRRGLKDVLLVISDAHEGLKEAIRKVLGGSSWQRCR